MLKKFDLYSVPHAAREIGVSQSGLYQRTRAGKVKSLRVSDGSWLLTPETVAKEKAAAKKRGNRFVEST